MRATAMGMMAWMLCSAWACGDDAGASMAQDTDAASARADGGAGSLGLGESGLAADQLLSSLGDAEALQLCQWASGLPGVGEEIDCGDGLTVTVEVERQCQVALLATCEVMVADVEACLLATVEAPCELVAAPCDPLFACSAGP
ncbi:MAG: hypothetical protein OEZ06_29735 [Myxococcales bacterium]|nr:hypothetical protein [Myxococcales bacterium]